MLNFVEFNIAACTDITGCTECSDANTCSACSGSNVLFYYEEAGPPVVPKIGCSDVSSRFDTLYIYRSQETTSDTVRHA